MKNIKKNLVVVNKAPIFATAKKETIIVKIYCGVEQLVARWAHNPKAVSSSLAPATITKRNVLLVLF